MVTTLSFDEARTGYRRWEHLMSAKPPLRSARRVSGLTEILDQFDAVILDNFGVLSLGSPAINAGTRPWQRCASPVKPLRILTNIGAQGIEAMLVGHQSRG
jgi:glycerol 3-phosphatase-2